MGCTAVYSRMRTDLQCKLNTLPLWGDKLGLIQVHSAREARGLQRGQAETCLRAEKEKEHQALPGIRRESCIQRGRLQQVFAGWQRSCWPSLPFSWWEALWGQSFATGVHSNSDSFGKYAKSKAWNEGEKPSNLEVLSSCYIKLKTSQLSGWRGPVKNNLQLACPLLSPA